MKYSFIVPIYNVENYLNKCVDSLLAQTYKDFEIILVDDGSTDSSGVIADMYAREWPEIIRVKHQENRGLGGARNTGIALSQGEYLLMVDSDDHVVEKLLGIIDSYLTQYNSDILIFDFIVEGKDGSHKIQRLHDIDAYTPITPKQYIQETPAAWNKVYRASLFKETEVQFPEHIFYEDLATSPCLGIHAKRIGIIEEALYYYVQRESSIMHTLDIRRITEIKSVLQRVVEYYSQQGMFEEYYQDLEFLTVRHALCFTIQRILGFRYDYRVIKSLEQFVKRYFPDYKNNLYVQDYIKRSGNRKDRWIIQGRYGSLFLEYILKWPVKRIMSIYN